MLSQTVLLCLVGHYALHYRKFNSISASIHLMPVAYFPQSPSVTTKNVYQNFVKVRSICQFSLGNSWLCHKEIWILLAYSWSAEWQASCSFRCLCNMAVMLAQTHPHDRIFRELVSLDLLTPGAASWAKLFKHLKEQGISYSPRAMPKVIWLNTCHIIRFLKFQLINWWW